MSLEVTYDNVQVQYHGYPENQVKRSTDSKIEVAEFTLEDGFNQVNRPIKFQHGAVKTEN